MKTYYGIFRKTPQGYSVQIPDVKGCWTQGETIEDAFDMASDALSLMLLDKEYPVRSSLEDIHKIADGADVMAVPIIEEKEKGYIEA